MKKYFLFLVIFSAIFYSCNEDDQLKGLNEGIKTRSTNNLSSSFQAGDFHTEITEICYQYIQNWQDLNLSESEMLDSLYYHIFINEASMLLGYSSIEMKNILDSEFGINENTKYNWNPDLIYNGLSQNEENLYLDIMSIVNLGLNTTEFNVKIDSLEANQTQNFNTQYLQSVLSVSKSSYEFWNNSNNFEGWFGDTTTAGIATCDPGEIVDADVDGAVTGAAAGAITGFGIIGGAALGGMLGTLWKATKAATSGC